MIESVFTILTKAMYGSKGLSLVASLIWGILSVLLSPCHLSSIPLIVSYISGQEKTSAIRAFNLSLCFSFGIFLSITLLGAITAGLGRLAGDLGFLGNITVAMIFILVGLHLLDIFPFLSRLSKAVPKSLGKGFTGAFLLGLIFGLALGPCTFAFMAPVLGVALQKSNSDTAFSIALITAYGIGHCLVIALAGAATGMVQRIVNFGEETNTLTVLRKICGVLVLIGGVYLVYKTI